LRKDVILWGLRALDMQGFDFKGVAGGGSLRRAAEESVTLLNLRTWGAAACCAPTFAVTGKFVALQGV
jgi:hypothetical protein